MPFSPGGKQQPQLRFICGSISPQHPLGVSWMLPQVKFPFMHLVLLPAAQLLLSLGHLGKHIAQPCAREGELRGDGHQTHIEEPRPPQRLFLQVILHLPQILLKSPPYTYIHTHVCFIYKSSCWEQLLLVDVSLPVPWRSQGGPQG